MADFNLELGYRYLVPGGASDAGDGLHEDPHGSLGRPGSRAPHIWLKRDGRRLSTLDLYGRRFVLVSGAGQWRAAVGGGAVPIDHLVPGRDFEDADGLFAAAHGITETGAVLVRPDGFVAWRERAWSKDLAELGRKYRCAVTPTTAAVDKSGSTNG